MPSLSAGLFQLLRCDDHLDGKYVYSLAQCFLSFFGFVHLCHRLLHSHSPCCKCTPDVTIIMVHRMFIASSDEVICSVLSTACFPPCKKLTTIFKHSLIADSAPQNVSSLHQNMRYLKKGKEKRVFTRSFIYGWWREAVLIFAQIFVLLLEKLQWLVMNAMFVL